MHPNFIVLVYWRETGQLPACVAAHYCKNHSIKRAFYCWVQFVWKITTNRKKRKIQYIIMHHKTRIVASYWVQMYLGKRKYLCNENRCNLKSNQDLVKLVQPVLILLRVLLRLRNFVVNWSASIWTWPSMNDAKVYMYHDLIRRVIKNWQMYLFFI